MKTPYEVTKTLAAVLNFPVLRCWGIAGILMKMFGYNDKFIIETLLKIPNAPDFGYVLRTLQREWIKRKDFTTLQLDNIGQKIDDPFLRGK